MRHTDLSFFYLLILKLKSVRILKKKIQEYYLEKRLWISSFRIWITSWQGLPVSSLFSRLFRECNSSRLAFLKRPITASFETAESEVSLLHCLSLELGIWSIAFAAGSRGIGAWGLDLQYSVQTWLQSSASIAWEEITVLQLWNQMNHE